MTMYKRCPELRDADSEMARELCQWVIVIVAFGITVRNQVPGQAW